MELPAGTYRLREPVSWPRPAGPPRGRVVYAAAHVVADPLGDNTPGSPAAVDWEATLRFRRHLWSYGLRVADAMDTAQRNNGLDWAATRELIRLSAAEARSFGDPADLIACGAGTDHVPGARTPQAVEAAYREQIRTVQESGATVILMASRQLAAITHAPDDYHAVYGKLLAEVERPAILHWLGEMFDPQLAGYWGSRDIDTATASFLELVHANAAKIDGVKVSLLDEEHEVRLRAALPEGVRLYTGDDFNYPSLIKSGSHALLGIFDAIAPAASAALQALDAGDTAEYDRVLDPTVALSRRIFEAPTFHYKTGIVFLAWLNGHQDAFTMVNGAQSARSLPHLAEVFRLADQAGLLTDPELAVHRMRALLAVHGR
ncbi:dihydrodipicolinate synthase family protein [Acrocarpospora phusangensis]|uniref:dihydrodipicolinate synthase family protein n=1 Tax=Acrocarpospora phusangensis TaxID=1070424 RepID=UPI0035A23809